MNAGEFPPCRRCGGRMVSESDPPPTISCVNCSWAPSEDPPPADAPRRRVSETTVLGAIEDYTLRHERPPTLRELRELTGISSLSVVEAKLKRLESTGRIERDRGSSRGIRVRRAS